MKILFVLLLLVCGSASAQLSSDHAGVWEASEEQAFVHITTAPNSAFVTIARTVNSARQWNVVSTWSWSGSEAVGVEDYPLSYPDIVYGAPYWKFQPLLNGQLRAVRYAYSCQNLQCGYWSVTKLTLTRTVSDSFNVYAQ